MGNSTSFDVPDNPKGEYQMEHSHPNNPENKQGEPNTADISIQIDKTKKTEHSKIDTKEQAQKTNNWRGFSSITCYEGINIIIMILIFFVTAIYSAFAGLQWIVLREQAKNMKETVNVMSDQFQLDQRAWIGIYEMSGQFKIGEISTIDIMFINSGKTPAKQVVCKAKGRIIPLGVEPDYTKEILIESKGILAPQQVSGIKITDARPVTEEHFGAVKSGKERLYIYGTVYYSDTFNKNHWVSFCYYLGHDMVTWTPYINHNNTDDN